MLECDEVGLGMHHAADPRLYITPLYLSLLKRTRSCSRDRDGDPSSALFDSTEILLLFSCYL